MARFVLGTSTFVEMAATDESGPRAWLDRAYETRGITDIEIAISAATLIAVERHFDAQANPDETARVLKERCDQLAQEFRDRNAILPVDDATVGAWRWFAGMALFYVSRKGRRYDLGLEERLVLATAIAGRLTLLDRPQPAHGVLAAWGLRVEDPTGT